MAFKMATSLASPRISIKLNQVKSTLQLARSLTVKPLTSNLQLVTTSSDVTIERNVVKTSPKPLALVFPWLMAKTSAVLKYASYYTDQGFDVLVANATFYQLMRPDPGCKVIAKEVAEFLRANTSYQPIVVHGFSVGAYVWTETMLFMAANPDQFQSTVDKFACQIWDSFAGVEEAAIGMSITLFPNSRLMQKCVENSFRFYMRRYHDAVTQNFITAGEMFFNRPLITAPALFMVSKADPIGTVKNVMKVYDNWRAKGIEATVKCWDDSPHVGHFVKHPQEYLAEWSKLMSRAGLLRFPDKFRAKL